MNVSNPMSPSLGEDIVAIFLAKNAHREALAQRVVAEVADNAAKFVQNYYVATQVRSKVTLQGDVTPNLLIDLTSLRFSYGRRLATLYCDAIDSINRRRVLLGALALRSFIEFTGGLLHFEKRITPKIRHGIDTQAQLDELMAIFRTALHGGRFNWEQFLGGDMNALISAYGSAASHNQEPAADIRQKSTAHFVSEAEEQVTKRWPNRAGIVRLVYAVLSDVCHPSRGGDLLFADGPFDEGWTKRRVEPSDEMLSYFLHMFAMPVFLNVAGVAFSALDNLQFLADGFTNGAPRDVPAA